MSEQHAKIEKVFKNLWDDYINLNPRVAQIHQLIEDRGEVIINDHVAFRTFAYDGIRVEDLGKFFQDLGYTYGGDYEFKGKKLRARHLDAPDPALPKVFISELLLDQCSDRVQEVVEAIITQAGADYFKSMDYLWSGRPWSPVSFQVYDVLRQESEYAGWLYVFGFRANHFTVNVNQLKTLNDLSALNDLIKSHGIALNQSGGEIKGGAEVCLSQSSTLADPVAVEFVEGTYSVPSCYYEFALRHETPSGVLYQGFIADNADKIFESTDASR